MMTKIIIQHVKGLGIPIHYEGRLIPMMGDKIDLPQVGIVEVVERIFIVDKPDQVILRVKR